MKIGASSIECAADRMTLELLPGNKIMFTIECPGAYEAGVLFQDISDQARKGTLRLAFKIADMRDETP